MKNKNCIIIVGPTAVGKTSLAIQIAKHFNTQIISADSRQCYKELSIGVAKPSLHDLVEVKHYFVNSHSIKQQVNAGLFEEYACDAAEKIFSQNDFAVMAGGTGLYINAFCHGIDEMPGIDQDVKKEIISNFERSGIEWLQNEVERKDPLYFQNGEIKNPRRLMRALEIKLTTGRSIIEYQSKQKKKRYFKIIKIGLELPKEQLHQNIHNRIDTMMKQGLPDEVKSLLPHQNLAALQTVGYSELFDHLKGKISLDEAIKKIKTNTRHYAKRQMTWFKKDKTISWIDAADNESLVKTCWQILSDSANR